MASALKKLAGETAVYGLSTILARIVNFLFVPIYTRLLLPEQYGVVTELSAYIAMLQVLLVMGLETGCFRFASKEGANPDKVFSNAFAGVFAVNSAFLALLIAFLGPLTGALGYAGYEKCVLFMGITLFLDNVTAILFAKLRHEHKSLQFALIKTAKIFTELGANLFLFLSPWKPQWVFYFVGQQPDFDYVIFSIFVSSVLCALLMLPTLLKMSVRLDGKLLKQMLAYSLPLMIAALPGIVNDFLDRVLFRFFDNGSEAWRASLGLFQASVKLAVIMNLFIQMFRFAAEPFFFQRAGDKNSPQLYAKVMNWFTAFCGLVFLGVVLYLDVIGLILGRDFREALTIVPIMLMAYMILGMNFNVSMWYKLADKTKMAIWVTTSGLVVTTLVNVLFMPKFSYYAAAWGHLASYLVMFLISAVLGARYYPIPYQWKRLAAVVLVMLALFTLSRPVDGWFPVESSGEAVLKEGSFWLKMLVHTALLVVYALAAYKILGGRKALQED